MRTKSISVQGFDLWLARPRECRPIQSSPSSCLMSPKILRSALLPVSRGSSGNILAISLGHWVDDVGEVTDFGLFGGANDQGTIKEHIGLLATYFRQQ